MMDHAGINFFTYSWPYGKGEQFIDLELKVSSQKRVQINVIPQVPHSEERIKLNGIHVRRLSGKTNPQAKIGLKDYMLIFSIFAREIIWSGQRAKYLLKPRYYVAYLKQVLLKSYALHEQVISETKAEINYTYWFDEITFCLCLLKEKKLIKNIITRAHGGDVYEYQHKEKDFFFPFRNYQLRMIDKICPVSEDGANHLRKSFKLDSDKLKVSRLASADFGLNAPKTNPDFVLLSCSTFFYFKRIPFLVNVLRKCRNNITWIHIGDEGDEKEAALKNAATLPTNINFNWKGQMDHSQVLEFYKQQHISLFINTSASEGLPVSIMEAISFGIPVIAPSIGGIPELVRNETGILYDKNISENELAALIDKICEGKIQIPPAESIRKFWLENYSVKNHHDFYREVLCVA